MLQCFFTKDKTGQSDKNVRQTKCSIRMSFRTFLNQNMKMHDKAHIPAFYHRLVLQAYP